MTKTGERPQRILHNYEGRLLYAGQPTGAHTYLQIFRDGCIEAVDTRLFHVFDPATPRRLCCFSLDFEDVLLEGIRQSLRILSRLGVEPPFSIMVSLLRVAEYILYDLNDAALLRDWHPFHRDPLLIPEVTVEGFDIDLDMIMKPAFDVIWNSSGWIGSPNYTADGKREVKRKSRW